MVAAVIAVYILIGLYEGAFLINKKLIKELIIYIFLMLFSMVINIMLSTGFTFYSPSKLIYELLSFIFRKNLLQ